MQAPKNTDLYETASSVTWLDEDGIICSVAKKAPPQTLEQAKKEIEGFRKKYGDKKYCMLLDITNAPPSSKEVRDWAAPELSKMVIAIAMISESALGRMIANLFFGLKKPAYFTKMFSNEQKAREWLMHYLSKSK